MLMFGSGKQRLIMSLIDVRSTLENKMLFVSSYVAFRTFFLGVVGPTT